MSTTIRTPAPRTRTEYGEVAGATRDGVHRFLGLPYAAPPVGPLRWRAPEPPASWEGVRDATRFGPAAVQTTDTGIDLGAPQDEDCLHLNVWTTTLDPKAARPVMLWIHGGGFLGGSASQPLYDGTALARAGVTLVTVNYRLGAFGFHAPEGESGNWAVQDWTAALRWVAENIERFGGDPARVTVFGQSAGAAATRTLLSTPGARGLFHRCVVQSAGFEDYAAVASPSRERVVRASRALEERLGTSDPEELRALPASRIREASFALSGIFPPPGQVHTPANLVWYPTVDGEVVTEGFAGRTPGLPVMFGTVAHESRFFVRPDALYAHPEEDAAATYTRETLARMAHAVGGRHAQALLAHYDTTSLDPYEALDDLYSTAIWFEPGHASLERLTGQDEDGPVYGYHFARLSPGARASRMLAAHAVELPYLFGTLQPADAFDEVDAEVADALRHGWVSFARDGVPSGPDGTPWPAYRPQDPRQTVVTDRIGEEPLVPSPAERLLADLRREG